MPELISTWSDSAPAWIAAVGGLLGAVASIYAIRIAVRAEREHVYWVKVVAKTTAKGTPSAFEIVNAAKRTTAHVTAINDITGDKNPALDTFTQLPMEVAPGQSFPLGISRTLANSYPTVVEIVWQEQPAEKGSPRRKLRRVRIYL